MTYNLDERATKLGQVTDAAAERCACGGCERARRHIATELRDAWNAALAAAQRALDAEVDHPRSPDDHDSDMTEAAVHERVSRRLAELRRP